MLVLAALVVLFSYVLGVRHELRAQRADPVTRLQPFDVFGLPIPMSARVALLSETENHVENVSVFWQPVGFTVNDNTTEKDRIGDPLVYGVSDSGPETGVFSESVPKVGRVVTAWLV